MNVFEFAMKMEKDGQTYYEQHAAKESNPALKKIWEQLAGDEAKHYEIFRRMKDGQIGEAAKMSSVETKILATAKTVFQELSAKDKDVKFSKDIFEAWEKAQDVEVETEEFYRQKQEEEKDPEVKKAFGLLADEEKKHVHLIEHVLDFLHEPRSWLEDAEFNSIDQM
jgi:rubrerythrin